MQPGEEVDPELAAALAASLQPNSMQDGAPNKKT